MLDKLESKREALTLIKKGCAEVKYDSSKISLIQLGILKMKMLPEDDIFSKLICAIGYEKMSMYIEAVAHYNCCIESLPDSPMKFGITGMKYRALAKASRGKDREYIELSQTSFDRAVNAETRNNWKKIWEASKKEVERII